MATSVAPERTPPGALFVRAPGGPPTSSAPAPNLLVLLHGAGDGPAPFAALATKLALPDTASLALKGPFPLGPGSNWYEDGASDASDVASLVSARAALAAAIDGAGWPRHRVHLFGYGDGGSAALDLSAAAAAGVLGPGPPGSAAGGRVWGSCVTVAAALLPGQLAAGLPAGGGGTARPTPILMTRGEKDASGAPADLAAATLAALKAAGLSDAALFVVPGKGAEMLGPSQPEVEAIMRHWARCLAAAAPAGCEEVIR